MSTSTDFLRRKAWPNLDTDQLERLCNLARYNPIISAVMNTHESGCSSFGPSEALLKMITLLCEQNAAMMLREMDRLIAAPPRTIMISADQLSSLRMKS